MLNLPIRKQLFWDVDMSRFDENINSRLVVERVFSYGTVEEVKLVIDYYGKERIRELIVKAGYLDRKTLSFAAWFLDIPQEKFRCYKKKQSNAVHWS